MPVRDKSKSARPSVRRLNVNVSERVFQELHELSETLGRSYTDLVRDAVQVLKIAEEESRRGNKLAIVAEDGKSVLREIVLIR